MTRKITKNIHTRYQFPQKIKNRVEENGYKKTGKQEANTKNEVHECVYVCVCGSFFARGKTRAFCSKKQKSFVFHFNGRWKNCLIFYSKIQKRQQSFSFFLHVSHLLGDLHLRITRLAAATSAAASAARVVDVCARRICHALQKWLIFRGGRTRALSVGVFGENKFCGSANRNRAATTRQLQAGVLWEGVALASIRASVIWALVLSECATGRRWWSRWSWWGWRRWWTSWVRWCWARSGDG